MVEWLLSAGCQEFHEKLLEGVKLEAPTVAYLMYVFDLSVLSHKASKPNTKEVRYSFDLALSTGTYSTHQLTAIEM